MQELEKILEEIDQEVKEYMEIDFGDEYNAGIKDMAKMAKKIIRKHMNAGWIPVEDLLGCEIELKPCPFCGCGAEMIVRGDDRYTARCRSCFCGTGEYKDPGRASEAWNRRADDEQNNRQ